jgi:hypothetical protein
MARPGREADHSPPSSAEVKMSRSSTSFPPWRPHGDSGTASLFEFVYMLTGKKTDFTKSMLHEQQLTKVLWRCTPVVACGLV